MRLGHATFLIEKTLMMRLAVGCCYKSHAWQEHLQINVIKHNSGSRFNEKGSVSANRLILSQIARPSKMH